MIVKLEALSKTILPPQFGGVYAVWVMYIILLVGWLLGWLVSWVF